MKRARRNRRWKREAWAYFETIGPLAYRVERSPRWRWWVHNLVAHPLLVLWPRFGVWLHDRTAPPLG